MSLKRYYLSLVGALPGFMFFSGSDVTVFLESRHGLERQQARKVARIIHGWIISGYVPAGL